MDDIFRLVCHCPSCKTHLDAHALADYLGEDDSPPQPGDFTVCGYCSAILCFTERSALRLATAEDLALMPPEARHGLEAASAIARQIQAFKWAAKN